MKTKKIQAGLFGVLATASLCFAAASSPASASAPTSGPDSATAGKVATELAQRGGTQVAPNKVDHNGYSVTFLKKGSVSANYAPSCDSGHLCVYTPSNNTVYDYYYCGYYDTYYLHGNGTFNNAQSWGTVAKFYNAGGSLRWTNTAKDTGTANWDNVYHIRPC